ncbi:GrpB family protein [Facklamia languida]
MVVVPYDERWKRDFLKIKVERLTVLEKLIIGIDHGGSRSVPGLSAKPIIDIDIVVKEDTYL